MNNELGYAKGEICNRDECVGIIDEHKKEGSCSCHINPPCSYCVDSNAFCPVCNWEGLDEQKTLNRLPKEIEDRNREYYKKQQENWDKTRELFYEKYYGKIDAEKLEMRTESHTHFSMLVRGVFPKKSITTQELLPKVRGTFGGRFSSFTDYSFEYIAYTD